MMDSDLRTNLHLGFLEIKQIMYNVQAFLAIAYAGIRLK